MTIPRQLLWISARHHIIFLVQIDVVVDYITSVASFKPTWWWTTWCRLFNRHHFQHFLSQCWFRTWR